MYTFGIILGIVIAIAIVYSIASRFRERCGRDFIVTGTGASLLVGEIGIFIDLFILYIKEGFPSKTPQPRHYA